MFDQPSMLRGRAKQRPYPAEAVEQNQACKCLELMEMRPSHTMQGLDSKEERDMDCCVPAHHRPPSILHKFGQVRYWTCHPPSNLL
eukprot:scaffold236550_cov23-Tisochrysis_lutea.AAC.1